MSKQESSCNGTLENDDDDEEKEEAKAMDEGKHPRRRRLKRGGGISGWTTHLNHFWIMTSLTREFRLPLMMQWEGGLKQLITWTQLALPLETLARQPRQRVPGGSSWRIAIKDLPGIRRSLVMRVARHLRPVVENRGTLTDHYLWLLDGVKMYFEEDASLLSLDRMAWEMAQARRGNVFFDAVGEAFWTPRPYRQKFLNSVEVIRLEYEAMKEKLEGESAFSEIGATVEEVVALKEALDLKSAEVAALQEALRKKDETSTDALSESIRKSNALQEALDERDVQMAALKEDLERERVALRSALKRKDAEASKRSHYSQPAQN